MLRSSSGEIGERLHPAVLRQLDRRQIVFERGNLLARHISHI